MGRRGMTVALRYIHSFQDRYGNWRHYFRRPGFKQVPLPGHPGTPEFMEAYNAALMSKPSPEKPREPFGAPGTFHRLLADYYRSIEFLRTKPSSQTVTRGILNRFADEHGHRTVRGMQRKNVAAIIAEKAGTPAAANVLLKKLKTLMGYAIVNGWADKDPTYKIPRFKEGTHHTWTDDELAQFEARWPLGTRQRTAYAMALYTGQRRGDLATWTRRHYDAERGVMTVKQEKTGAELAIPMHRALREALEAWKPKHIVLLANEAGTGTSVAGLGNFMADAIEAAGLPARCVLHGLRKAAARRLAEAGCSPHQIMAITGHKSLDEVQRYCDAARQVGLARDAIDALERNERRSELANSQQVFAKSAKKSSKIKAEKP